MIEKDPLKESDSENGNLSRQKEIIAALWAIAAITSFGFGYKAWGVFFSIKAIFDTLISIRYAIREVRRERDDL